ncbi:hypothetical protein [Pendulispora albinea]|uniref:Glycoside hydrolase family 5 domain-containing protein n=1 Tax=Pendulispora albinea TaxID=2741071 RepID=A0ABZ2M6N3_9BACT
MASAVPDLEPPRLEVGYNYTWPFARYGTTIGPRDIENDPPTGANDRDPPEWLHVGASPPGGSLARNLRVLRDELEIRKVRIFLLGNAYNYGNRPVPVLGHGETRHGRFKFTAPSVAHPLFREHFRQMLRIFEDEGMQMLPSLIDFGAFYPVEPFEGAGGGRADILSFQRAAFIETMLKPLVQESKAFGSTVFAWEVVNEPRWNLVNATPFYHRPHTKSWRPDASRETMSRFISECLKVIEAEGFASTVGHRFFNDLRGGMPTGTMPQFHYYGATPGLRGSLGANAKWLAGISDSSLEDLNALESDPRTRNAFIGELATAPGGRRNRFGDKEDGEPWIDCGGRGQASS